ncbi:MAG: imidazole glycerol phosphate synthase subunit HisH [Candidatus Paceibacterota bacterium]
MKICIIDYGMGNIASVSNAIHFLNKEVDLISDPKAVVKYDTIILPGVGAFSKAMERLKENGLDQAIKESVHKGKRLIGICLGMQLLFTESLEFGSTQGLGIIDGNVLPFKSEHRLLIPHIGWNEAVTDWKDYKQFNGDYYFVHSFHCVPEDDSQILFRTNYGIKICSAVNIDNQVFGFQFHPEKSQKLGLQLLNKVL